MKEKIGLFVKTISSLVNVLIKSLFENRTSDIKFKTNISTLTNALDTVKKLRGVSYNKIENGDRQIGMIAQELQDAGFGEFVHTGPDGFLSVEYDKLTLALLRGMKELIQLNNLRIK